MNISSYLALKRTLGLVSLARRTAEKGVALFETSLKLTVRERNKTFRDEFPELFGEK